MKKIGQFVAALSPTQILIAFILLNLLVAFFIAPDYGLSTDETVEFDRSSFAKAVFLDQADRSPEKVYTNASLRKFYGTALTVIIRFIEPLFSPPLNTAHNIVGHYFYFFTFQLAVIGIFLLAKQFFNDWLSLGVALLFGTQPLLFGHAFINPKDIPLMAMFLLTVSLGFQSVDTWGEKSSGPKEKNNSKVQVIYTGLLAATNAFFWFRNGITGLINQLVTFSYLTKGESLPGKIFAAFTTYGSLEGYLILTGRFMDRIYRWSYLLAPLLILGVFLYARKKSRPGIFGGVWLLLAGFVWGIALSTRVIALAAGGIVGIYALVKHRQHALYPLTLYTLTAGIVSLITWPFLWFTGFKGIWEALVLMSEFPKEGTVLFEGLAYQPHGLPAYFVPKLMLLQFTEPVVILSLAGMVLALILIVRRKLAPTKALLLFVWLLAPIVYDVLSDNANYSNFRQYLFVIPPLFIFSGFILQWLTRNIKQWGWNALLFLVLIIPGIVSLANLHPYQYIYYNQFVGGVEGAYRQYDLDYWLTSYKKVFESGLTQLPAGSQVLTQHHWQPVVYSRSNNIASTRMQKDLEPSAEDFDYVLLSTYRDADLAYFPDAPVVFAVEVSGATLMVLKKLPGE